MRVCLVNAPIGTDYKDAAEFNSLKVREESCYPQLGILSLAACLEKTEWPVRIFDTNRAYFEFAEEAGEAEIRQFATVAANQLASLQADIYGFGSICSGYPITIRLAKLVKAIRPDATILFGGPQASVVAEQTLAAFPFVDYILRGEAEHSLPVLLEELAGNRRFPAVPGLTYRSPFGIQRNADAPLVMDLDSLPCPAYHLTGELCGLQVASLELGRGCPFACTFCSTNDFFRRRYRLRSPHRVLEDMAAIESEYGIRAFQLNHDMFTVDAKRVREFCNVMAGSGKGYTWNCSARTDCVDEELIGLMAASGCKEIFYGVETGSERMQKVIDKHLDTSWAHELIDITDRAGMGSTVSLIAGFPDETWEDLSDTLDMFMHSARTPKSKPQLNLLAPLANTPLYLKHSHELTLNEFCSDVTQQGRLQDPEDADLIRKYPEIFSSFYLVPTPHLDRATLFELQEFVNSGLLRFRWILAAAGQTTIGIATVFRDWVKERKSLHPGLAGSELRLYYRLPRFAAEFCDFLSAHPAANDPKLRAFLEFYEAMNAEPLSRPSPHFHGTEVKCEQAAAPADVAARRNNSRIVECEWDIGLAMDAVTHGQDLELEPGRHFYVIPEAVDQASMFEVSIYIATLAKLCDGRTVEELMRALKDVIVVTPESAHMEIYKALLEEARSEGIIALFRTSPAAPEFEPHTTTKGPDEARAAVPAWSTPSLVGTNLG